MVARSFPCALTPFTLQDFPGYIACIVWIGRCNFRCRYCHNPEFLNGSHPPLSEDELFSFLKGRQGILEGVVFSGGECTLCDGFEDLIRKIRDLGFLIKIDTNGSRPDVIRSLVSQGMIDAVGLDYKAPREKFFAITRAHLFNAFRESLIFLCGSGVSLEIRTTVHTDLLTEDDIGKIIADLEAIGFTGTYVVQNARTGGTLDTLSENARTLNFGQLPSSSMFRIAFRS